MEGLPIQADVSTSAPEPNDPRRYLVTIAAPQRVEGPRVPPRTAVLLVLLVARSSTNPCGTASAPSEEVLTTLTGHAGPLGSPIDASQFDPPDQGAQGICDGLPI